MSLLTDADRQLIEGLRAGVCTGDGPCISTPVGTGDNWITKAGGDSAYVHAIVHALMRKGRSEQEAERLAHGILHRWASGAGKVSEATRERARRALAHWEEIRAKAHGSRAFVAEWGSGGPGTTGPMATNTDPSDAGGLLPRASSRKPVPDEAHAFRGTNLQACAVCGQPATADIHHKRSGVRASGAYAAGHPFYGNQYEAIENAQTPQQLAQVVHALAAGTISVKGGGGGGGSKAGGGAGSKAKAAASKAAAAKRKAARHQASVTKAAANKQAVAQRTLARREASLKKAGEVARQKAAHDRQLASQAKSASAKQSYTDRAAAYDKVAAQATAALQQLEGQRSDDGDGGGGVVPLACSGHRRFDPSEPRDAHGRWTLLGELLSSLHAMSRSDIARAEPEHGKTLVSALKTWESDHYHQLQADVTDLLAGDKTKGTPQAEALASALQAAAPRAPELYRGLHLSNDEYDHYRKDVFADGKTVDIPPSSFSSDKTTALSYGSNRQLGGGNEHGLVLEVAPGSRALNGEKSMTRYGGVNREWISGGRYRVTGTRTDWIGLRGQTLTDEEAHKPGSKALANGNRFVPGVGESYPRDVVTLEQTAGFG